MIKGSTKVYGVLGWPVSHSLSPKIHNAAFEYFNIDAVYVAFGIGLQYKNSIVKSLTTLGVSGVNVTVPYKSEVIPQLAVVDPYAFKINSVNTILKEDDKWKGYSTDGPGFINALARLNLNIRSQKFLLLGAGGAAKAIAFALAQAGAAKIYVKNRTQINAENLIKNLNSHNFKAELYETGKNFDVLVNSTSLGLKQDEVIFFDEFLPKAKVVIDIVYRPEGQSALIKKALSLGKVVQDGLPMLISQALLSFKLWTGKKAPYDLMEKALGDH